MFKLFSKNSSKIDNKENVIRNVSANELDGYLNQAETIVLDVRTEQEFKHGHLPDALNIDFYNPEFPTQLDQLDKGKRYLVYCQSGSRSMSASKLMNQKGFFDLTNLSGGISSVNPSLLQI